MFCLILLYRRNKKNRHVLSFYLQKAKEKEGTERKRYLDFLDILLSARDEHDVGLTPLEIRNEADTFLKQV
jgi:hypothetical protein